MSRGQRPRTPAEFPRMKDRAAGRHMRNRQRIVLKHFLALGGSDFSPFDAFARLADQFVTEVAQPIIDRVRETFLGAMRRSDFALVPAEPKSSFTGVGKVIDVVDIGPSSAERQKAMREEWLLRFPSTAQWPVDGPR